MEKYCRDVSPKTSSLILGSSDREPEPLFGREEAFIHKPLLWPDGQDYIKMERYFVGHHVLSLDKDIILGSISVWISS